MRLVLRIGTTRELSALALKKSGANGSVTRSSLYLPRSSVGSGLSSPEPSYARYTAGKRARLKVVSTVQIQFR